MAGGVGVRASDRRPLRMSELEHALDMVGPALSGFMVLHRVEKEQG